MYEEALKHPNCKCIFITRLVDHPVMPCDAFFPGHLLEKYPKTVNITHKCHALLAPNLTIDNEGEHVTEGLIVYRIDVLSGEVKNWC